MGRCVKISKQIPGTIPAAECCAQNDDTPRFRVVKQVIHGRPVSIRVAVGQAPDPDTCLLLHLVEAYEHRMQTENKAVNS